MLFGMNYLIIDKYVYSFIRVEFFNNKILLRVKSEKGRVKGFV